MQKNIYLCDMEKEFVIYSLALRMKKLGYNGPCFAFYQVENFEEKPCGVDDRDEYIRTGFATCKNSEIPEHFTSAPTWQQAFRWFREKYDLEYAIIPESESGLKLKERVYNVCIFRFIMNLNVLPEILRKDGKILRFMYRDNAEKYCLQKLIEIVEQKTEVI
jgi:hypothetical protein